MSALPSQAADLISRHTSNGHRLCYATSIGPITLEHAFSRAVTAKTLRCTKRLDGNGNHADRDVMHRDGNCCWRPHEFTPEQATQPQPEHHGWEQCIECGNSWPCDVARLGELLVTEQ